MCIECGTTRHATTQENYPVSSAWHTLLTSTVYMYIWCMRVQWVYYASHTFIWDSLIFSRSITQQVTFAVIPRGMINELVTQGLQPWASKTFSSLIREVDWCKLVSFFARYKSFKESQVNVYVGSVYVHFIHIN